MLTNNSNKINTYTNNTETIIVTVTDGNGNIYDLTDYNANLYAVKYPIKSNSTIDISIGVTYIDVSKGEIYFDLATNNLNVQPGDYLYEVVIDDGDSNKHTVAQNKLTINKSIF